jgi:hypothetical protein
VFARIARFRMEDVEELAGESAVAT